MSIQYKIRQIIIIEKKIFAWCESGTVPGSSEAWHRSVKDEISWWAPDIVQFCSVIVWMKYTARNTVLTSCVSEYSVAENGLEVLRCSGMLRGGAGAQRAWRSFRVCWRNNHQWIEWKVLGGGAPQHSMHAVPVLGVVFATLLLCVLRSTVGVWEFW